MILVHNKVCDRCARARGDTARFCDEGWQFAKDWTRQRNAVEKIREHIGAAGTQLALFP